MRAGESDTATGCAIVIAVLIGGAFVTSWLNDRPSKSDLSFERYLRICDCKESGDTHTSDGSPIQSYRCRGGSEMNRELFEMQVYRWVKDTDEIRTRRHCS